MKPRGGEGQNGRLKCPTGFVVIYREENREPKIPWNRFETPPSAVETQVIHRRWEGKSILLNLFPLF